MRCKVRRRALLSLAATTLAWRTDPVIAEVSRLSISVADFGAAPGTANAGPGLRAAIAHLPKSGGATLYFPPGTYRFAETSGVVALFGAVDDIAVDGHGATLLFAGAVLPFLVRNCRNFAVTGLTIDWERPPFSQGEVIAVAPDSRVADIRIDPEFPVDGSETVEAIGTYDRGRRTMAIGAVDAFRDVDHVTLVGPQLLRLFFKRLTPVHTGDTLVLRHRLHGSNVFRFEYCTNLSLEDVRVYAAPGMAVIGEQCDNARIHKLQVMPKPGSNRLISTCVDGIHFASCSGAIDISDCDLQAMGDDGINVHGSYYRVVRRIDSRTLVVAKSGDAAFLPRERQPPGEHFAISSGSSLRVVAEETIASAEVGPQETLHFTENLPSTIKAGDYVADASRSTRLHVWNCHFTANRGRGVLAHSNALIENCHFADQSHEALLLQTASPEGPAVDHTTVRNNEIVGVLRLGTHTAAIRLDAFVSRPDGTSRPSDDIVNHDVRITDNTITDPHGAAISAGATAGLVIDGNRITRPDGAAIILRDVQQAVISKNICTPPASIKLDGIAPEAVRLEDNSGLNL